MVRKMLRLGLGTRAAWATLVMVLLLAAACGGGTANVGSGATVPQAGSTSTISSDPYGIPSPITGTYVQRVLDVIEAINADAMRIIIANNRLVPDAARRMRAVNTSSSFSQQTMIVLNQLHAGLTNYRQPPGPVRDHVQRVLSGSGTCIFAAVTRDYSALEKSPETSPTTYVALHLRISQDDPGNLNPTPWVIDFFGYNNDGRPVQDSCASKP
jgi:hypothetical protein